MKLSKRELKENMVYLVLWLILFIAPILSVYVRSVTDSHLSFEWREVLSVWKLYAVYLVVFIVHNYLIAPILIYRHRKAVYFTSITLLLVAFILYQCQAGPPQMHDRGPGGPHEMGMMEGRPPMMGDDHGHDGPPPMPDGHKPDGHKPDDLPPLHLEPDSIFSIMVFFLMLGMNLGIKLYFKMDEDAKEMQELEKRSLEQQLAYLKYQINPHFFMNTLNNIHALVDIDPEKSKETILILSKIMRHVLYEGDKGVISLHREVEFLNNYIELMKIRYTDKVSINMEVPKLLPDAGIPPLLLITFVENAFKHGVSYKHESFIDIKVSVDDNRLKFICRNSKADTPNKERKQGGVGLQNVKQRLGLLYGNNFTLDIEDGEQTYEVVLFLPLQNNS